MSRRLIVTLLAVLTLPAAALPASAQEPPPAWPTKFVRLVVPGGSGTIADVAARIMAQHLATVWGQQVIVENRPGAGGMVGTAHIAQSAPDGYSLLFAQGAPLSLTPHTIKSVPYDVERDFEPVIFGGYGPLVLAASTKLPAANVAELIELARQQPGKLSFATASARSIPHLAGEHFMRVVGVQMINVPYVGYPRAIADVIAGTVDVIFAGAQIIPQRDGGKLKMLGVTTSKRIPGYEDIPAIAETVPNFSIAGWVAVMAPKGTPAPIVAKINADMRAGMDDPEVLKRLHRLAIYPDTAAMGTPEALARFIRDDSAMFRSIVKAANMQPQEKAQ